MATETYFDLGLYRRAMTGTPDAQVWVNRGLAWTYGYHHEEAIVCFTRAAEIDPDCALAHWGVAYAIGPNYNKGWEDFEPREKGEALGIARAALDRAQAVKTKALPVEAALIDALEARYPADAAIEDYAPWHQGYSQAMRDVAHSFPDDLDVLALFAEALMNRTPWQLWDLPTGAPAEGADTLEAVSTLEGAFDRLPAAWAHPGLLHMYIHLMEMSPWPERALRHGDHLLDLVPDSGHLIHMPTHIDVLCGDYQSVIARNMAAMQIDRKWFEAKGGDDFYTLYRVHNISFVLYGALFIGQKSQALWAAEQLIQALPRAYLLTYADWFEAFIPKKQEALIRFGLWDQILDQDLPAEPELYAVTTATMHYARAIALANTHHPEAARAEADLFYAARDRVPESRMLFNNTSADLLHVAAAMMEGELTYHAGDPAQAFDHLREAVRRDDGLNYDEPWGWLIPTRHALGALLLDQGAYAEAEAVYRADLGLDGVLPRACQHPRNVWALHGLHECLVKRGDTVELPHIRQALDQAMARTDVPIRASCYCRAHAA